MVRNLPCQMSINKKIKITGTEKFVFWILYDMIPIISTKFGMVSVHYKDMLCESISVAFV